MGLAAERATALNDPKENDDDRQHQQHVNETTDCGGADHAEQPQDEQDDRDCLKHERHCTPHPGRTLFGSAQADRALCCIGQRGSRRSITLSSQ